MRLKKKRINYFTLSILFNVLFFAVIFKDDIANEIGGVISGVILKWCGVLGMALIAFVAIYCALKAIKNYRILKDKKIKLYFMLFIAVLLAGSCIDLMLDAPIVAGEGVWFLTAKLKVLFGSEIALAILIALNVLFYALNIGVFLKKYGMEKILKFLQRIKGNAKRNHKVADEKVQIAEMQEKTSEAVKATAKLHELVSKQDGVFDEKARVIENVLESGGISAEVCDIIIGASIIRFEVNIHNTQDIARVEKLKKALLSRLMTNNISIEAPILGKDRVGIDIPNLNRKTIFLSELIAEEGAVSSITTVPIGREVAGQNMYCDLAEMPHLLIAGSTGSGKSVCVNGMIVSLLKRDPKEVQLVLVDPKRVEFNIFEGIPHSWSEVAFDDSAAFMVLDRLIAEMELRYKKLADSKTKNIKSYNEKNALSPMSRIIVFIDEFAELMIGEMKTELESRIQRLTQKARAAGIHLVLATQRPSVDVVTGVIKANLPSRMAFKLSTGVDSRTILDENGAEDLIGSGDMYFKAQNMTCKMRIQAPYISEEELAEAVTAAKEAFGEEKRIEKANDANANLEATLDEYDVEGVGVGANNQYEEDLRKYIAHLPDASMTIGEIQARYEVGYMEAKLLFEKVLLKENE